MYQENIIQENVAYEIVLIFLRTKILNQILYIYILTYTIFISTCILISYFLQYLIFFNNFKFYNQNIIKIKQDILTDKVYPVIGSIECR